MNHPTHPPGAHPKPEPGQFRSVLWWITAAGVALLMAAAMVVLGKPHDL